MIIAYTEVIIFTLGENNMALPKEIDCINCEATTSNYYIIKTNKGDLFRCKACYEANFMRNQRDEYSNYNDTLQQAKKP
tara:strand:+ start:114 stop:350 length:237 start_codon:yes stop_codon:yes gene_type:complete